MARVLVVDDEKSIRVTLGEFLKGEGHQVELAADAPEALGRLAAGEFDVVVSDIVLPRVTGVELLARIRAAAPHVKVVMMTGEPTVETAAEAVRAGATDYLVKPIPKNAILRSVAHAAEVKQLSDDRRRLEAANELYQKDLERLVQERTRALRDSNKRLQDALEDLKENEQRMIQQERLNALGQMVSGIAHDFNNVLMPILGFSDYVLTHPEALADREETRQALESIRTAAEGAREVVRRLREFYRPHGDLEAEPVRLDELINEVVTLTEPRWKTQTLAAGKPVNLETEFGEVPVIMANEARLKEALTNLVINAVDAMPEGGTIKLSASAAGKWVSLRVEDAGTGMTEEVRRRCLEPFFSTKGERGTGLGLAMCHGILQRHGGELDIESAPGRGTIVTMRLPRRSRTTTPREPRRRRAPGPMRGFSVLAADDDRESLALVEKYLRGGGYTVRTATGGKEAVDALQTSRFDVLVTDRAMPGMAGDAVALAARQKQPDIRVIMLTGFGDLMTYREERPEGVDRVLAKPLTAEELMAAVEGVMT